MGKIDLKRVDNAPVFRKIAMGSWKTPTDPSVYARMDIDMKPAYEFLKEYQQLHGVKITPAHMVGAAISKCIAERPEVNGLIRGSRIYLRKSIDLFFQINIPGKSKDKIGGAELSGTTIKGAEKLKLYEISRQLKEKAEKVRSGKDKTLKKSIETMNKLPWWAIRWALNLTSWLTYGLNLNLSFLGIPKDPFGSVMITNVGSFGIDMAWAPLVAYSRVPFLLTVGSVQDKPIAVNGEVKVHPIMSVGITFDHRFMDGIHASQMARTFKTCFAEPEKYFS